MELMMNNKYNSNIHERRRQARERWQFDSAAKEQTKQDLRKLKIGASVVLASAAVGPTAVDAIHYGVDAFNDKQEQVVENHFEEYPELRSPAETTVEVSPRP